MSMILDALKRSSGSGGLTNAPPGIISEPSDAGAFRGISLVWVMTSLVGVIVITAMLSFWLITGGYFGHGLATDTERPADIIPVNTGSAPAPNLSQEPAVPKQAIPARISSEVAELYTQPERVSKPSPANGDSGSGMTPKAIGQSQASSEGPVESPRTAKDTTDEEITGSEVEQDLDVEAILRRAQQSWGDSQLVPSSTPLLEALSQQQKDRIPTLMYTVHQWATDQPPSVVLNGARLGEGQRVGGFQVREILVDSVILVWGDVEFRLPALNSWINL